MDDWQDEVLTTRHLHNRSSRKVERGKQTSTFNVQRILGTYELRCPTVERMVGSGPRSTKLTLELQCLNPDNNAILGHMCFPGVLDATVVLAGSRKTMTSVLRGFQKHQTPDSDNEVEAEDSRACLKSQAVLEPDRPPDRIRSEFMKDDSEPHPEERENSRFDAFEKNIFRSPKFWMKWQSQAVAESLVGTDSSEVVTDTGYLVFSGNSCDKFEGTLSCQQRAWNNIKLKGWKVATKPQCNVTIDWR